ncbi:DUF4253 domain-containing protein [Actinomadura kijaniata]|uniref:DUF4253 domain-containing protein n=1 Tax=Actinomadura kijaniata TaxID=46161 RepID=UPI003F19DC60
MEFDALPPGLPPGRLVTPDPDFVDRRWAGRPVLWVSDEPVAGSDGWWARLYERRETTGLYPLLLDTLSGSPDRPWHLGELGHVPVAAVDALDAAEVLRGWWEPDGYAAEMGEGPPEPWPGLAEPGTGGEPPDAAARETAREIAAGGDRLVGLAPAARGADTLAAFGWQGPLNHTGDTGEIAVVVRSWEERFGARVVAVGFDTLDLSVAAPPRTPEHARRVAVEHRAFCPDAFAFDDLDEYAGHLVGCPRWAFWWD